MTRGVVAAAHAARIQLHGAAASALAIRADQAVTVTVDPIAAREPARARRPSHHRLRVVVARLLVLASRARLAVSAAHTAHLRLVYALTTLHACAWVVVASVFLHTPTARAVVAATHATKVCARTAAAHPVTILLNDATAVTIAERLFVPAPTIVPRCRRLVVARSLVCAPAPR